MGDLWFDSDIRAAGWVWGDDRSSRWTVWCSVDDGEGSDGSDGTDWLERSLPKDQDRDRLAKTSVIHGGCEQYERRCMPEKTGILRHMSALLLRYQLPLFRI